jgi:hypothetical protein
METIEETDAVAAESAPDVQPGPTPLPASPAYVTATHVYRELSPEHWAGAEAFLRGIGADTALPTPEIGRVIVAISRKSDDTEGQIEGVRTIAPVTIFNGLGAVDGSGVTFGGFDKALDRILPPGHHYYALVQNETDALSAAFECGMQPIGVFILCARATRDAGGDADA